MHLRKETGLGMPSTMITAVLVIINRSHYWEQPKTSAKTHHVFESKGKRHKKENSN